MIICIVFYVKVVKTILKLYESSLDVVWKWLHFYYTFKKHLKKTFFFFKYLNRLQNNTFNAIWLNL